MSRDDSSLCSSLPLDVPHLPTSAVRRMSGMMERPLSGRTRGMLTTRGQQESLDVFYWVSNFSLSICQSRSAASSSSTTHNAAGSVWPLPVPASHKDRRSSCCVVLCLALGASLSPTTHTLTGKQHVNFALGQPVNARMPVAADVMRRETFTELYYCWTAAALAAHTLSHTHAEPVCFRGLR